MKGFVVQEKVGRGRNRREVDKQKAVRDGGCMIVIEGVGMCQCWRL